MFAMHELECSSSFSIESAFASFTKVGYKLMQFTGLKDKNGKEIYEGDILKLHCSSNKEHVVTATIEWLGVSFFPRIHNTKVFGGHPRREVPMWEMHSWCGTHDCLTGWPEKLEVIGNIYENPELLDEPKKAS
jgi:uncharacterized phage protein (TIGR01671 family)